VTIRVRVGDDNRPRLRFTVRRDGQPDLTLDQDDVLFVPGLGTGVLGKSPIQLYREGLGITVAAERYGARFFQNDATPGVVLKHPGTLGDEAYEHLKTSWSQMHQGGENAHRPAILEEGMSVDRVGLPP